MILVWKEAKTQKIFALVVVFGLCLNLMAAFANHIEQPQLPDDGFYNYSQSTWDCGKMLTLYYDAGGVGWGVYILDGADSPIAVRLINEDDSTIIWLDHDRDGHFDEKYSDVNEFVNKYPTPCDAAKEQ